MRITAQDFVVRSRIVEGPGFECFVDLVVESSMNPWDFAALIPIIEAAGGRVTSWNGGEIGGSGQILAVGDPALHDAALEILAPVAG